MRGPHMQLSIGETVLLLVQPELTVCAHKNLVILFFISRTRF
jgi:hypothetical protein